MNVSLAMRRRLTALFLWGAAIVGLLLVVTGAHAAPLSVEDRLRVADYARPVLSPSGRYLAVLVPVGARVNLAIVDLDTRKIESRIDAGSQDIVFVRWAGEERLLFSVGRIGMTQQSQGGNAGGLFVVSRDGKSQRMLFPPDVAGARRYVHARWVASVRGDDDEIVVALNDVDEYSDDLYRMDLTSGRRTLLTGNRPRFVADWVLDSRQVPRVAITSYGHGSELVQTTFYRDSATSPWRELWRVGSGVRGDMKRALAFDDDDRILFVASNEGRDTMGVFAFDPATGQRGELIEDDPRYDTGADAMGDPLGRIVPDPATGHVAGWRVSRERAQTLWRDERAAKVQAMVDEALPGTVNELQRSTGSRTLVSSYSDVKAVRFHLLDESTSKMTALFTSRPWLDGRLPEMKPFRFEARDGMALGGYLFEPAGARRGQRLPLVVHIHGGPWSPMETWGEPSFGVVEAQLLASRGYAVILPSFRGTTGLGRRVFQASRGEWGRAMQEDIEDAVDWAVKTGVADAGRVCLSGASYGGYASLMGVAKTPDKYRCAIAGMPVTDLAMQIEAGPMISEQADGRRSFYRELIGDPATMGEQLRATSPAYLAPRIKARVMLYSGVDDHTTLIAHAERMRDALKANGQDPLWIVRYGEGHGFSGFANRKEVYERMFEFLDRNIGTSASPAMSPATTPATMAP